ncbi:MAG TPA: hypothetical protein PL155_08585 [Candidatus Omnitrophota bacterium]|nr:hypothetical protein [Candidatus Omnitrophota bacterium]HPD85489.1 hypothetical protein [Candidatus Omnitrophota bacterium]HRZ04010.1 hypothetical protein [Candidatus Omnitrophota bacterium]
MDTINKKDLSACIIIELATFLCLGISLGLVLSGKLEPLAIWIWIFLALGLILHGINHIIYWKKYHQLTKSLK